MTSPILTSGWSGRLSSLTHQYTVPGNYLKLLLMSKRSSSPGTAKENSSWVSRSKTMATGETREAGGGVVWGNSSLG